MAEIQGEDDVEKRPTSKMKEGWCPFITALYPNALKQTYCVPALHLNRVSYQTEVVPGTNLEAYVALDLSESAQPCCKPPQNASDGRRSFSCVLSLDQDIPSTQLSECPGLQESDLRDDCAQRRVLANFQTLGDNHQEPMFILSKFKFKTVNFEADPSLVADPSALQTKNQQFEADLLIFHRHHGLLIMEVKSVGKWHKENAEKISVDEALVKKVQKSLDQLQKLQTVLRYLVSDVAKELTVNKTLCLPYVTKEELIRVLNKDKDLSQAFVSCIGGDDQFEAVQLCLCADQLFDPDTVQHDLYDLTKLQTWWRKRMALKDRLLASTEGDNLYLNVVARFVGPASTVRVFCVVPPRVELWTAGQARAELGRRLSCLVLTPQQLRVLSDDAVMVCITGPPGTGKTVLLVLKALGQLLQGIDVHIVSTRLSSLPSAYMIQRKLQVTLLTLQGAGQGVTPAQVFVHPYTFSEEDEDVVDQAIHDLWRILADARGRMCVIMDEVVFDKTLKAGPRNLKLMQALKAEFDKITAADKLFHLWCACTSHGEIPDFLKHWTLHVPLRAAANVVREVEIGMKSYSDVAGYRKSSGLPAQSDGPPVVRLVHEAGKSGHTGQYPVDCKFCGTKIASNLQTLGVGPESGPSPLKWRDVFIGTRSSGLSGSEFEDKEGHVTEASAVVAGLRAAGVPVVVLSNDDHKKDPEKWRQLVRQVAWAESDAVTVSNLSLVHGLERPMVVLLAGRDAVLDVHKTDSETEPRNRFFICSRCTTQLVVVDLPRLNQSTEQLSAAGPTDPVPEPSELIPHSHS